MTRAGMAARAGISALRASRVVSFAPKNPQLQVRCFAQSPGAPGLRSSHGHSGALSAFPNRTFERSYSKAKMAKAVPEESEDFDGASAPVDDSTGTSVGSGSDIYEVGKALKTREKKVWGAGEGDTLRKWRPTTPGTRHRVTIKRVGLWKGKPYDPLCGKINRTGGRNSSGKITVWWRGGGNKHRYRKVDFKRRQEFPGIVERIEYDPNRSGYIALVTFPEPIPKAYILAPQGLTPGQVVDQGEDADPRMGNCLPLHKIPVGFQVCNIELKPGKGGQLIRSAGTFATVIKKTSDGYVQLRLKSGEQRLIHKNCRATIGVVSNLLHKNQKLGKAGASRWRGRKPHVRGVAMNPVDHPMGGGEGKTSGGRPSCTPWGVPCKGYRTRKPKTISDRFIIQSRHQAKRKK